MAYLPSYTKKLFKWNKLNFRKYFIKARQILYTSLLFTLADFINPPKQTPFFSPLKPQKKLKVKNLKTTYYIHSLMGYSVAYWPGFITAISNFNRCTEVCIAKVKLKSTCTSSLHEKDGFKDTIQNSTHTFCCSSFTAWSLSMHACR